MVRESSLNDQASSRHVPLPQSPQQQYAVMSAGAPGSLLWRLLSASARRNDVKLWDGPALLRRGCRLHWQLRMAHVAGHRHAPLQAAERQRTASRSVLKAQRVWCMDQVS